MESDDEIRRVPEMGGATDSGGGRGSVAGAAQPSSGGSKRRGRSTNAQFLLLPLICNSTNSSWLRFSFEGNVEDLLLFWGFYFDLKCCLLIMIICRVILNQCCLCSGLSVRNLLYNDS